MAARAYQSKSRQRRFFMLMGAADLFRLVGRFPMALVGIPYDEQIGLGGLYEGPVIIDTSIGFVPPGLTLEISIDGTHARLHGTPTAQLTFSGNLPGYVVGCPYSARLQFNDLGAATITDLDLLKGALPAWMSMTFLSGSGEVEFTGTPT